MTPVDLYCFVCAPDGPSVPFGAPMIAVFDTVRVMCYFLAGALIVLTPKVISRAKTNGQRVRFAALALFTLTAVGTEIDHLGDGANYRLFVNVAALVFSVYGVRQFFREQGTVRTR